MAACKTTTLTFRIEPTLKEALRTAAALDHRSISNMVEILIRDYCLLKGISVEEPVLCDSENQDQSGK